MSQDSTAAKTVELAKKFEDWARSTRAVGAQALVLDATDLYRAALAYVEAVDRLLAHPHAPAEQHAKTLVEIQTWLYDE